MRPQKSNGIAEIRSASFRAINKKSVQTRRRRFITGCFSLTKKKFADEGERKRRIQAFHFRQRKRKHKRKLQLKLTLQIN